MVRGSKPAAMFPPMMPVDDGLYPFPVRPLAPRRMARIMRDARAANDTYADPDTQLAEAGKQYVGEILCKAAIVGFAIVSTLLLVTL